MSPSPESADAKEPAGLEGELLRLLEWQHAMLEGASHAMIATDAAGTIVSFNRAAEAMLGYRADELIGAATPEVLHDRDEVVQRAAELSAELGIAVAPGFDAFVARARRGEADEREWTYIRKDGSRLRVLLAVTALRDADDAIRGYLGISQDIGLRKRLEEATAQAKANHVARALIRAIAEGVIGFEEAVPHRIRYVNPHAEQLLGVGEAAATGRALAELIEIGDAGCCRSIADWPVCPEGGEFEATVKTQARPDGFYAALTFVPVADHGDALAVLTLRDVTARREAEDKLRLSDKVFEFSAEAIVITDPDANIVAVNPAFTWLTGYRPDEAIGRTPRILKSGRHDERFYADMWKALLADGYWQGELWDRRKDGSEYPKWLTINAVRGECRNTTHYVALFSDISERKENENRIRFLAEHDHLTGLPNRRLLEMKARQLIASERRRDAGLALMLIDLDRFKNINDTLGHAAGDRLLIEVARRLVDSVRASDTVVRLGGDEFVVLLEGAREAHEVVPVAAKLREALNRPIVLDGHGLHTPPSIGIALYPRDGGDIETLLRNADTALYQVKASGRNNWLFYSGSMNDTVRERLQLEEDLRRGIENGDFELHFQPQFEAVSGRILVWEALLRWNHPQRGAVAPDDFIPTAEETGLILPLGEWVLRSACREAKRWQQNGHRFRVGVNVSARQFADPDLAATVERVLAETGLEPDRLELEITESLLIGNHPQVTETLRRLKALGIGLTLDDFGTGYSSLAYLKSFAIDRLKIDRLFVRDVDKNGNDAAIVRAMISLAQALGIGVVAEGVETEGQHAFLRAHGCPETQGFLLGAPMPAAAIGDFLAGLAT